MPQIGQDYWFFFAPCGHRPITSLLSRMVNLAVLVPDIVAAILRDILRGHVTPSTWRLTRLVGGAAGADRRVSVRLEPGIILANLAETSSNRHNGPPIGSLPVGSLLSAER
ncbi:MAG: hypothetical protein ACREYC_23995 [Gammaproteobacteria bacterium]